MANEIEIRVTSTNRTRSEFAQVERDARRMGEGVQRETRRAFNEMVSDAHRAGQQVADTVEDSFNHMVSEARDGGQEAGRALARGVDDALERTGPAARDAGEEAGRQFTRGLDGRLRDARGRFVAAGADAGEGFGDGAEEGGQGRMRRAGGAMAGALRAAPWLAAGAAIGAVIVQGVQGAMEAEAATATLKAQLGEFGAEGERLATIAGQLFRDAYGESLSEVNEAIRSVKLNISGMADASDAEIKTVTKSVLNLAEAFQEDIGETARAVGKLVKTGLATDATDATNILTKAFQRGANEADDLLETVSEYSTQFRSLGLSGEQAMGLIVQGLRAGAREGDTVADTIKEFTIEAVAGGERVRGGFESLGLNAQDMVDKFAAGGPTAAKAFDLVLDKLRGIDDEATRNAVAVELFGTKSEDMQAALYAMDPSSAVAALGDVGGAAEKMGDTLHDTAQNRLTSFTRTLKGELVDFIGGPLLGSIEEFVQGSGDWFEEWSEDNSEAVEGVQEVWDKLGETWDKIFSDIEEFIAENEEDFEEWSEKLGNIIEDLSDIISSGLDIILELWEKFGPTILEVVGVLADTLIGWWEGLFETLKGIYDTFAGLLTGDWERFWDGIQSIAEGAGQMLWSMLEGVWGLIVATVRGTWRLIGNIVEGAWEDLKDRTGKAVGILLGWFDKFFDNSKKAFRHGVDAIGNIWDDIKSATKAPVKFVVDVVYNNGIRPVWNFVAGIAGMGKLDKMAFADGGIVDVRGGGVAPGYSAQDNRVGLFRDGEGVLIPEAVQSLGAGFIDAANRAGGRARDLVFGGDPGTRSGRIPGFRDGGIVGAIKGAIGKGVDLFTGAPKMLVDKGITEWAEHLLAPGRRDPGGGGWWGDAIGRVPPRMIGGFLDWVKDNLADLFMGGGDFGQALSWAKNQAGKPYVWGGVGPGGYDCSGFMSAITNVIRGDNPFQRLFTTFSFSPGSGAAGFVPGAKSGFEVGVTNSGVGHMAGTLNGTNVESRGSAGVVVGPGARGAGDGLFNMRFGYRGKADNGAILAPGWNPPLYNGTGEPEQLVPASQIPEVHLHVTVENHGVLGSRIDVEDWLTGALESLNKQGRLAELLAEARR